MAISSLEPPATAYSPAEEALLRCCAAALAWDTADEEDKPEMQVLRLLVTSNQVGWRAGQWTVAMTRLWRGCKPAPAAVCSVHIMSHMCPGGLQALHVDLGSMRGVRSISHAKQRLLRQQSPLLGPQPCIADGLRAGVPAVLTLFLLPSCLSTNLRAGLPVLLTLFLLQSCRSTHLRAGLPALLTLFLLATCQSTHCFIPQMRLPAPRCAAAGICAESCEH